MVVQVVIADDQADVRSALKLVLTENPRINILGEAADSESLVLLLTKDSPDVILMDWELPGLQAGPLIKRLRGINPDVFLIGLDSNPANRKKALAAGFNVFVSKGDPPDRLFSLLEQFQPTL